MPIPLSEVVNFTWELLTDAQVRLYNVLKEEENRSLLVKEVCRKAGVTAAVWHSAIADPNFLNAIEAFIDVAKYRDRLATFTPRELQLLAVIEQPENRNLPVDEVCRRIGLSGTTLWYQALKKPRFKDRVKALGYKLSKGPSVKNRAVPLAENPDAVWAKDRIDVRLLVSNYPKHMSAGQLIIDFSQISNVKLKTIIKRYFRQRFHFWTVGTIKGRLGQMLPFLLEICRQFPDLETFAQMTRDQFEPVIAVTRWTDIKGRVREISAIHRHRGLIGLNAMFTYLQLHGWECAPTAKLIFREDRGVRRNRKPRPLPDSVYEQVLRNLHRLPDYSRNLTTIMAYTGLRVGDALHLKEDCLEFDGSGDPRLRWFNMKMNREDRPLPINNEVADAIRRQRELVKDVPDIYGERYLFRTSRGVFLTETYRGHLDRWAKDVPILGPDGQVYRIQTHQFRHTVGTQMINNGMGIADVMTYLGHSSPEMTMAYAEITDDTLKQKFKQLVLSGQVAGGVAVAALQEQLAKGDESELDWVFKNWRRQSLPHGYCLHHAKAPACPHANACFTVGNGGPCSKLMTTPEFLPSLRQTLIQIEDNIDVGSKNGWEMYVSNQENQAQGIRQVIKELELPVEQRSSNRGGRK